MDKAQPVVLALPGMEKVEVVPDLPYKRADGGELRMDVYRPPDLQPGELRPAVVFVHGDGPPEALVGAKDWGQYVSWGRLAAASGFVGVTFDHRSTERLTRLADAAADVDDLIKHVRAEAEHLGIHRDAICLWTCSAGAPIALRASLAAPPPWLRCVVALYALLDLEQVGRSQELASGVTAELFSAYSPLRLLASGIGAVPPLFVARAGADDARFNDSIDRFLSEAITRNVTLDFVNHPTGRHAFDVRDDDERSRRVIRSVLAFIASHMPSA